MKKSQVPDTIGVSLDTREGLRLASESVTIIDIPGYKLTREIGRGSFGTVWQAVREKTGQNVAVKIVENSQDLNWEYFRRELDFLGEIEEHPNTLTILDAQLENDPPYIVMPLAEGGSLEEVHRRDNPEQETIEPWLIQMAEALAFIHRKGVIHCDLKPSNVLLSSGGAARIADLGQARRTGHGVAMGTIGFMAPEQCAEETKASPSVSWDVYGYGATAYWLLTGKIPRIKNGDGVTLGTYLKSFETSPLVPVRKYNPTVDKELAAIVEGCLERDAQKRIPSLDAVLEDFERRRDKRPLLCRRPWTTRYRVATALKRRTVQVMLFILASMLLASAYGWRQRQENKFLSYSSAGIHAHESGRFEEAYLNWLEALDYRSGDLNTLHRLAFMPMAQVFPHMERVNDFVLFDSEHQMVTASADGSVTTWQTLSGEKKSVLKHPSYVSRLAINSDETWLATASWDGKARLFELKTRELKATLDHDDNSVTALTFHSHGKYLITADLSGKIHLWQTEIGAALPLKGQEEDSYVEQVLATHPTRPLLAALSDANSAAFWNLETGERLPSRFEHKKEINEIAFTPDGRRLITVSDDNMANIWDVESGALTHQFAHDSRVNTVFVMSNTEFITGCEDGNVTVWSSNLKNYQHQFYHRRPIRSLTSNEDRTLLVVGTGESDNLWSDTEANGTVNVWDLGQGYRVGGPWPHDGPVEQVRFCDEDRLVLSASGSARQTTAVHPGAVRSWRYFQPSLRSQLMTFTGRSVPNKNSSTVELENGLKVSHGENVLINQYALDQDGVHLATASEDRTIRVWDAQTGESVRAPILLSGAAKAVAFDSTGELIASASEEPGASSGVRIWEIRSGYPVTPKLSCPGRVLALEFSSDGSKLVAETERGQFSWDLDSGKTEKTWRQTLHQRLRAKLDRRNSVVPAPEVSEMVMTVKL